MPQHHRACFHAPLAPLALLWACTGTAVAQDTGTRPYYIGVSQSITRDSNVLRAAAGPISDTISSTGLLAGIDQPFGRQRFMVDALANANRYRNSDELNNNSYSLSAGLDWSTIEHLSGTLRYSARQYLSDTGRTDEIAADNLEKTRHFTASARWALASRFAFEGGAEHRRVAYSVTTDRNNTQKVGRLGLVWGLPELFTVGVGGRITKGDHPNRVVPVGDPPVETAAPDSTDRKDVDLTITWSPSPLSTLSARVSATREEHSDPLIGDFSGATGRLSWAYQPGGRLSFTAAVGRDTGSAVTFLPSLTPEAPPIPVDTNRVTTYGELGARYEATAKISLNASAYRSNGSSTTTLGTPGDSIGRYALGLRYDATRAITLGCNLGREERSDDYTANTVGCFGQIVLR